MSREPVCVNASVVSARSIAAPRGHRRTAINRTLRPDSSRWPRAWLRGARWIHRKLGRHILAARRAATTTTAPSWRSEGRCPRIRTELGFVRRCERPAFRRPKARRPELCGATWRPAFWRPSRPRPTGLRRVTREPKQILLMVLDEVALDAGGCDGPKSNERVESRRDGAAQCLDRGRSRRPQPALDGGVSGLRRGAAGQLRRERRGHTLQPTALVHEAHVRAGRSAAGGVAEPGAVLRGGVPDDATHPWSDRARAHRMASDRGSARG
jgi:ECF sigma factor